MSKVSKTIQEKTDELAKLTAWFDSDDFTPEQALDKFKQAETLALEIESDLTSIQNDVQIIKKKFDAETA